MSQSNFVFVTPAFNCQDKLIQTIKSVYAQSYNNWRMVVYDDMSTDNTPQIVEDLSKQLKLGDKLKVVSRTEKYGEVRNTLDAVNFINNDEVVCRLDGGDWLVDIDALAILDQIYRDGNPSVLWTKHRWSFTPKNISGPLDKNVSVYKQPWVSSHLKTFRKSAINNISVQNFKDDKDNWIMIACDQAVFLPIIHKAMTENKHCIFLPIVMYHYDIDIDNPNLFESNRSKKQKYSAEWIRARGFIK